MHYCIPVPATVSCGCFPIPCKYNVLVNYCVMDYILGIDYNNK